MMRFILGVLAYVVPTFALGFVWHLVIFESYYDALAIYRSDIIIPFGFLSILIQAVIFAWIYETSFARRAGGFWTRAVGYGAVGAVLSWTFTTLAVAAKNIMSSVPDYLNRDSVHDRAVDHGRSAHGVGLRPHDTRGAAKWSFDDRSLSEPFRRRTNDRGGQTSSRHWFSD
jgi:hypothetical protein